MSSEMEISQFLDGIQTPVSKIRATELRQREQIWRALWSWLDDEVKFYITRIGSPVRIIRRDYKGSVGELGQVHFDLKEIELTVYEKQFNYNDGKYYFERKTLKIPSSVLAWFEFINTSELAEEVEKYEVEPIPEEEGVA